MDRNMEKTALKFKSRQTNLTNEIPETFKRFAFKRLQCNEQKKIIIV